MLQQFLHYLVNVALFYIISKVANSLLKSTHQSAQSICNTHATSRPYEQSCLASIPRLMNIFMSARIQMFSQEAAVTRPKHSKKTSPVFFPSFSIFPARCIFLSLSTLQIYEYFCLYIKFFLRVAIFIHV